MAVEPECGKCRAIVRVGVSRWWWGALSAQSSGRGCQYNIWWGDYSDFAEKWCDMRVEGEGH